MAKPFLRWAGGKTQLLGSILPSLPSRYGAYHEPFVGGGAVFFALRPPGRAVLSDVNIELITTYTAVRDDIGGVVSALKKYDYTREFYYYVRGLSTVHMPCAEVAARMIYLNLRCFNGLYRVNGRGEFNVAYGSDGNPRCPNYDNLAQVSQPYRVWISYLVMCLILRITCNAVIWCILTRRITPLNARRSRNTLRLASVNRNKSNYLDYLSAWAEKVCMS